MSLTGSSTAFTPLYTPDLTTNLEFAPLIYKAPVTPLNERVPELVKDEPVVIPRRIRSYAHFTLPEDMTSTRLYLSPGGDESKVRVTLHLGSGHWKPCEPVWETLGRMRFAQLEGVHGRVMVERV